MLYKNISSVIILLPALSVFPSLQIIPISIQTCTYYSHIILSFSWPHSSPPATCFSFLLFTTNSSVTSNLSSPVFSWTHQLGFSSPLHHWNSSFQSHQWRKHHTFQVLSLLSTYSKFLLLISFLPNLKMLENPRAQSLAPFSLSTFISYFIIWP